ncbi:MAG TPA: DUF4097 domain-containing protein [Candidatus Borkfalkia excrementigallinarum]|uniref:DUF4097 domain-containing protein n=1 Tax=Candidatus Borkfalkia excrementigallinarum TaxID=2838506 RepID=A0A9D1ZXT3_9FIRM|nr:DUF4097 domain-containing protein [Candidatus Borkfalkia excrementigallinarum]
MKKLMAVMASCAVLAAALAAAGCSDGQTFEAKSYVSGEETITSVVIDVEDRAVEVTASEDGQVHIEYSESEKEFYDISVSESGALTMTFETDKSWTDYIGTKPAAEYRLIKIALPSGLTDLTIKTTNESVDVSPLSVREGVTLDSNGGDLNFEKIGVGESLSLTAKNGNITGSVLGGMDDFSIACEYKKGECNLPENKEGGSKSLKVNCNNGDIAIEFAAE